MATRQSTVDYILDQLRRAGAVTAKKMFGEFGLYLNGRMFALVCDDQLFIKRTPAGEALLKEKTMAPPYPGAKPCYLIDADLLEDAEALTQLAGATANALPEPAAKSPRPRRAKAPGH
jgi:DNA transformation protein